MAKPGGRLLSAVPVVSGVDKIVDIDAGPSGVVTFLCISFADATAAGSAVLYDDEAGPTDSDAARKKARNISGTLVISSGLYRGVGLNIPYVVRGGDIRNPKRQLKLVINVDKNTTCYINYVVEVTDRF